MSDYSSISFKNNGKLKLLIIVGTRPEIIRLAAVINKTRKYFDVILAHTGQNYDYNLNGVFFHDLQLADPEVYMNAVGADLGETMGNIIAESYKLMVELKPDSIRLFDRLGQPVERPRMEAQWEMEAAEKGGYPHFMLKEIFEQPEAIRKTVSPRIRDGRVVLDDLHLTADYVRSISRIFVVACGSSYHVTANPPKIEGICNACGSELVTRPDDVPETVRSRLAVYHKETEALKGFYEKLGKLRLIEGNQPIEDATRDILAALGVSK